MTRVLLACLDLLDSVGNQVHLVKWVRSDHRDLLAHQVLRVFLETSVCQVPTALLDLRDS